MRIWLAFWPVICSKLVNFHYPDPVKGQLWGLMGPVGTGVFYRIYNLTYLDCI